MNARLVFVFTTCVVIANGLCMSEPSDTFDEKKWILYRHTVSDRFMTADKQASAIYRDDFGNIFIRILVSPGSKRSGIFVPNKKAVGVYLYSPEYYGDANDELLQYFVKMLDIRKNNIILLYGSRHKSKILKVLSGIISIQDVLRKIVDRCIKTKRHSMEDSIDDSIDDSVDDSIDDSVDDSFDRIDDSLSI